jgi:hypothetical protein
MSITINIPFDIVVALAILLLIALTGALVVLRKARALVAQLLVLGTAERDRQAGAANFARDQELLRR